MWHLALNGSSTSRRSFASSAPPADPYKVLGVSRSASQDEIKEAFHKQALEWHPDRQPAEKRAEAQRRFSDIASAYEVLSDPQKRRQFDNSGMGGPGSPNFAGGGFATGSPGGFRGGGFRGGGAGGSHSQESAERIFRDVFGGGLEDIMAQMFGHDLPRQMGPGAEVKVSGNLDAVLRACRESGIDSTNDTKRKRCLGRTGVVIRVDAKDQTVKVKVPGIGDVWLGLPAVQAVSSQRQAGRGPLHGFSSPFEEAFGAAGRGGGFSGGSDMQMRQQMVQRQDGTRVIVVTRSVRMPDGSIREEVTETPL